MRKFLFILLALLLIGTLVFRLTPWPAAMLIRTAFDAGARKSLAAMRPYAPTGITTIASQPYRADDPDALLDVYLPDSLANTDRTLPVVVWVHGGGWLSGSRLDVAPYCQLLASKGYVVVSVDYSLAPGAQYPTAIRRINEAVAYIGHNAQRFHADMRRVFLAGDSAGAQLSSQFAAVCCNVEFATTCGVPAALRPEQLRGLILHCGIYDLHTFRERANDGGIVGMGSLVLLRAYGGRYEPSDTLLDRMSTIDHVDKHYPAVFISGGNGDPLTAHQSRPFAARLAEHGVDVTTFFFADDHTPVLPHEYQFQLDGADAQEALARTVAFLDERSADTALP